MNLKTVNIKGKQYVEVNTRLKYFRENYKDFSLESEIVNITETSIIIKAIVKNSDGRIIATGLAHENKNDGYINKTSHIENCETSAWGRALGNLGIGIDSSVATYDEVKNAIEKETNNTKPKPKPQPKPKLKPQKKVLTSTNADGWNKVLDWAFKNGMEKIKTSYQITQKDFDLMKKQLWDKCLNFVEKNGIETLPFPLTESAKTKLIQTIQDRT